MIDIKSYEAMSKLNLPEEERSQISAWADMLMTDFDAFSDIDTSDTEPLYTVLDVKNVLREDISVKMLSREELLENAPMQYDGYFQVPKTL